MTKTAKTQYMCNSCGDTFPKWAGQCPSCKSWNTIDEFKMSAAVNKASAASKSRSTWAGQSGFSMMDLDQVPEDHFERMSSTIGELDRVLGGGMVKGSVILLGGDPGIGKSTILTQVVCNMGQTVKAAYISGEESAHQVSSRASRMGLERSGVRIMPEAELELILNALDTEKPDVVIVDSIQTIFSGQLESSAGSVSQVKECAAQLTRYAKQTNTTIVLVGHVTKDGTLAGPRVLEHIVDAVLYFEGEQSGTHRMIRAFKNRFGAVNELGIFKMIETGLEEVLNPGELFLSDGGKTVQGCAVSCVKEGQRSVLVELQTLVEDSHSPNAKRLTVGFETQRVSMVLAVLAKHAGLKTWDQNIYVNVVGGFTIKEPAADLACALAICSSVKEKALKPKMIAIGEVGLSGEIRVVPELISRIKEASKLGFESVIVPKKSVNPDLLKIAQSVGITVFGAARIGDALTYAFNN